MTMHEERWALGIAENGDIRLRDQKTGEALRFGGPRGLYEALGVLADWREGDEHKSHYGVDDAPDFRVGDWVVPRDRLTAGTLEARRVTYVIPIEGTGKTTPKRWQFRVDQGSGEWLHCDDYETYDPKRPLTGVLADWREAQESKK